MQVPSCIPNIYFPCHRMKWRHIILNLYDNASTTMYPMHLYAKPQNKKKIQIILDPNDKCNHNHEFHISMHYVTNQNECTNNVKPLLLLRCYLS